MLLSLAEIYFPSPTKSESTNSLKFRFSLAPDEGYSVYRGKNQFLDFWGKNIWNVFWVGGSGGLRSREFTSGIKKGAMFRGYCFPCASHYLVTRMYNLFPRILFCPSLAPQGRAGENPGNKVAACRVIEEDMKQIGHFRVSPGPLSVCESSKNLNGVS